MRIAGITALVVTWSSIAVAPIAASQVAPVVPSVVNTVVAIVTGLRNDAGVVRIGLYDTPSRWPRAGQNARACNSPIRGRLAQCAIPNVSAGTYALAITHDENNNDHFDQGFLGWPLEGFGFSNNVRPRLLGPPSWDSARFVYPGGAPVTITMTMQY